jgi:hypothetical protein
MYALLEDPQIEPFLPSFETDSATLGASASEFILTSFSTNVLKGHQSAEEWAREMNERFA